MSSPPKSIGFAQLVIGFDTIWTSFEARTILVEDITGWGILLICNRKVRMQRSHIMSKLTRRNIMFLKIVFMVTISIKFHEFVRQDVVHTWLLINEVSNEVLGIFKRVMAVPWFHCVGSTLLGALRGNSLQDVF